jgi:hypothetical protein
MQQLRARQGRQEGPGRQERQEGPGRQDGQATPAPVEGGAAKNPTGTRRSTRRLLRAAPLYLGTLALSAGLLEACGSSPSHPAASPAAKSACQQVSAALSDGPDPDADPVGYALAQVRPLGAIKVSSDATLQRAIDRLAAAYQTFSDDNGTKAAKQSVKTASKTVNDLCPGAGAGI